MQRWCVVGAGYAGIAAARALLEAGFDVTALESGGEVGGLWSDGTYDSVRLITTRRRTAYPDRPMAGDPAGFPTRVEMRDYLQGVARETGVTDCTRTRTEVSAAVQLPDGRWRLTAGAGDEVVDGLVLATGAHRVAALPALPGSFRGRALHSSGYRRPSDLAPGPVLVVGVGNSGADIAVEAAAAGHEVLLSARSGRHVLPRSILGRPTAELAPPPLPNPLVEAGLGLAGRLLAPVLPRAQDHGLPRPDHGLLERAPVIHDGLLPAIADGRVAVHPGVARLRARGVAFCDGSTAAVDTIVWATGYRPALPLIGELPPLVAGLLPTDRRNLAVIGLRTVRGGAGRYLTSAAHLIAAAALAQSLVADPIGSLLGAPDDALLVDERRELAVQRRLADELRRLARAAVA